MFNDYIGQKKSSFGTLTKSKRFSFQPLNTRQRSFERNKIAFNHNLSKRECTQISNSDIKLSSNAQQQQLDEVYKRKILQEGEHSNRVSRLQQNNIKVICKFKRSNSNERQIEICQKENNRLEIFDTKTFLEVECDKIFTDSQPSLNKEIWQVVKEGVEESYEKKENYTLILHGSSKTGKNQILLNKSLLNLHNSTMQIEDHIIDNNAGLLERTVNHLLLKYNNEQYEVLISVIGFVDEKAIDLLNLEQDVQGSFFTLLKLKRDQKNIQIENLIQMGIRNIAEYQNHALNLYYQSQADFLKRTIFEELGVKISSVIYQVVVAQMSNDRENIHKVVQKLNFVKISNCSSTALSRTLLNYCIEKVSSTSNQFTPYKDSKLTSFLEDTLTKTSVIQIIPCLTDALSVKSQLATFSIISSAKKLIQNRKHYVHDPEIVAKVYTQEILEVKDILSQFENGENIILPTQEQSANLELPYLANQQEFKNFLGVAKNNKDLQEYKSSAMIETESFTQKRKVIRSNSQLVGHKELLNTSTATNFQNKENNKYTSGVNKSFHMTSATSQTPYLDFSEQFKPFSQQTNYASNNLNNKIKLQNSDRTQQIYRKQYYKQNKIFLEPLQTNDSSRRNTNSYRKSSLGKNITTNHNL